MLRIPVNCEPVCGEGIADFFKNKDRIHNFALINIQGINFVNFNNSAINTAASKKQATNKDE